MLDAAARRRRNDVKLEGLDPALMLSIEVRLISWVGTTRERARGRCFELDEPSAVRDEVGTHEGGPSRCTGGGPDPKVGGPGQALCGG